MKGIGANKDYCLKLLLNSIGISTFNIISALAAPKMSSELDYDELIKLLKNSPTRNLLVPQHRFLSKYQNDQQSIAELVATLRADIGDCDIPLYLQSFSSRYFFLCSISSRGEGELYA